MTVAEVKELALKHYEKGGDVIVECYTDEEIEELLDEETISTERELLELFNLWKEMADEYKGHTF